MKNSVEQLFQIAKKLLVQLIETPSISREEHKTADLLCAFFAHHGIKTERIANNVLVRNRAFSSEKPTVLLNSHHDTVKPVAAWHTNPFEAIEREGKMFGLGSNDAGAPLVSLAAAFLYFYEQEHLPFNLLFVASAEEEVSGAGGLELVMKELHEDIACAIVGEPTSLRMAVAEKGLLVLDCTAHGTAGHAAHATGENALYKAVDTIQTLRNFAFEKSSEFLGTVKTTVTMIQAGTQHNVIPAECTFTVDVRTNEHYTNAEVLQILEEKLAPTTLRARSLRLNSSHIALSHPLVHAAQSIGIELYGSPTMSDQVFLPHLPSVKIGPGDTLRSHTANEFIYEHELKNGIETYIQLLENLNL
ncbi:MAG: M20/M25/M40 family metallo-hydrolase [Bacteroidales bacterium]|jgi:acetylornithine deacetylase|nr:M20/M25/M40 family metallo-hydrolase [Bacteroidales bacterium]